LSPDLGGFRNFAGATANATGFIQVVPFQCVTLRGFMGLLKIVALNEGCHRPLLRLLDALDVVPASTHNKPSVAAAFNTKAMCAEEVIQP